MNGILLVNKPANMTSHDVINQLRKKFKTKKIGHCGTLDPLATGVLVCLVNKATKVANLLVLDTKEYYATFKLGIATTTQDLQGEVVATKKYLHDIDKSRLLQVLESYQGDIEQTPSIYSAIKVKGKKLYEYARQQIPVDIPSRIVNISQLDLVSFDGDNISIRVNCSSGTYIRTLCYDIGNSLGYPAVLTKLERTRSGKFLLSKAYNLDDITPTSQLIDLKSGLAQYLTYTVDELEAQDVYNGKKISVVREENFLVIYNDQVIALYSASDEFGQAKCLRGLW